MILTVDVMAERRVERWALQRVVWSVGTRELQMVESMDEIMVALKVGPTVVLRGRKSAE